MSFIMEKVAEHLADKAEGIIKGALGVGDKDEDKKDKDDDKEGGFLSIFKRDKDDKEDDRKDWGRDRDRDRDDGKGNVFKKWFNKDDEDDDEKVPKKSGFAGLFSEQGPPGAGGPGEGGPEGYDPCSHMREEDLDKMSDLMDMAK